MDDRLQMGQKRKESLSAFVKSFTFFVAIKLLLIVNSEMQPLTARFFDMPSTGWALCKLLRIQIKK